MTPQEAFTKAVAGVLAQGKPAYKGSVVSGKCFYRAPDGCKCHIGQLIPDELYRPEMDMPMELNKVLKATGLWREDFYHFAHDLQVLHDVGAYIYNKTPNEWLSNYKERVKAFALSHNLSFQGLPL